MQYFMFITTCKYYYYPISHIAKEILRKRSIFQWSQLLNIITVT